MLRMCGGAVTERRRGSSGREEDDGGRTGRLLRCLDDAERCHRIPWVDGRIATVTDGGRERAIERRIVAWERGDGARIVADAQASRHPGRFRTPSGGSRIETGAQGIL